MKRRIPVIFASLVVAAALLGPSAAVSFAQEATPATTAQPASSNGEKQAAVPSHESKAQKEAEKEGGEEDNSAFRHSANVQALANMLHLNVETTAKSLEFINFGIVALLIVIPIVRILPRAIRKRSETIQSQLKDARTATEDANARLSSVEQRLSKLDEEISSIQRQVEKDSASDEARIKASMEEERKRIVDSASHEIDAAMMAARRELKKVAAEMAVDRAVSRLALTPELDRRLVDEFARELGNGGSN